MNAPVKPGAMRAARKPARPAPARRRERMNAPSLEQEADRMATSAMASGAPLFGTPRPLAPHAPLSSVPAVAQRALRESGQPLDRATRAFMESRLGYDFSGIRIHSGAEAARSADALGALAFAAGDRIVFDAGQYRPHDSQGRWLLAHELSHIVQQAHGATPALLHKGKGKTPPKFYQSVIDEIAPTAHVFGSDSDNVKTLNHLLDLCKAVDQEKTGDITKLVEALSKDNFSASTGVVASNVMGELVTRMNLLGFDGEARKLELLFPISMISAPSDRQLGVAQDTADRVQGIKDISTPGAIAHSFTSIVNAMRSLRNLYSHVNHQKGFDGTRDKLNPDDFDFRKALAKPKEFLEKLLPIILQVHGALQTLIQSILDSAGADLAGGKARGAKTLAQLNDLMVGTLLPVIAEAPPRNMETVLVSIVHFDVTTTGHGKIDDAFPTLDNGKDRSVPFDTYDPKQTEVKDQQISMGELFHRRMEQISGLARLYGQTGLAADLMKDTDDKEEAAAEAEQNKGALAALPKGRHLHLDSDDDWRAFAKAKFQSLTKPPRGKTAMGDRAALEAVVHTLFYYLRTFAVHAHAVSIYDFGPSYVNRKFPRALSGQLVHDCGVYAVRVAYILSTLRADLGLKFRFVLLPAHIALAMQVKDGTIFIFENDQFHEFTPHDVGLLRRCFENPSEGYFDELRNADSDTGEEETADDSGGSASGGATAKGGAGAASAPAIDEDQLIGELAAGNYIPAPADMPFALVDIPDGKTLKDVQEKLWAAYEKNVQLAGASDKDADTANFLLMKDYLALLDKMREVHNTVYVRAWNHDLPAWWKGAVTALSDRKVTTVEQQAAILQDFENRYHVLLKPVDAKQAEIGVQAKAISKELADNPKLRNPKVRLSNGVRAFSMVSLPLRLYGMRLKKVRGLLPILSKDHAPVPLPLMVDEASPASTVRLFPPFLPQPRNSLNPEN